MYQLQLKLGGYHYSQVSRSTYNHVCSNVCRSLALYCVITRHMACCFSC